jgi:hypothetical protein
VIEREQARNHKNLPSFPINFHLSRNYRCPHAKTHEYLSHRRDQADKNRGEEGEETSKSISIKLIKTAPLLAMKKVV